MFRRNVRYAIISTSYGIVLDRYVVAAAASEAAATTAATATAAAEAAAAEIAALGPAATGAAVTAAEALGAEAAAAVTPLVNGIPFASSGQRLP